MPRGPTPGNTIPLGRLTVGEKLGEGGFGVVHVATLDGIDGNFAIKFLDPSSFNEDKEGARKRFLREANVLFRLRHPHIAAIYGVGEHEQKPYILMERFHGFSLDAARKMGTPDPMLVLPFIEFIADALAHAHSKNVVHRDIKPSNLMTTKGDARILDFGVAGLLDPGGERFTRTSSAVAGDVFSAPELTETPKLIDPRCDLFSLGACWFWLLTGTAPKGKNWESRLRAAVKVERAYEDVMMRCLDQPENRYPTGAELAKDIRALRAGQHVQHHVGDLSDDEAQLLGVIQAGSPSDLDKMSFYRIEQELQGRLTRLRAVVALQALQRRAFLHDESQHDSMNDDPYKVYWPTDTGSRWAAANLARIEELEAKTRPARPVAAPADDDIPF